MTTFWALDLCCIWSFNVSTIASILIWERLDRAEIKRWQGSFAGRITHLELRFFILHPRSSHRRVHSVGARRASLGRIYPISMALNASITRLEWHFLHFPSYFIMLHRYSQYQHRRQQLNLAISIEHCSVDSRTRARPLHPCTLVVLKHNCTMPVRAWVPCECRWSVSITQMISLAAPNLKTGLGPAKLFLWFFFYLAPPWPPVCFCPCIPISCLLGFFLAFCLHVAKWSWGLFLVELHLLARNMAPSSSPGHGMDQQRKRKGKQRSEA